LQSILAANKKREDDAPKKKVDDRVKTMSIVIDLGEYDDDDE
jgi:hypothetical protein